MSRYNIFMTEMIDIKIASNPSEIEAALSVRRKVFVEELKLDENIEFDGNDYVNATHLLALADGKPIGTIRIRNYGEFTKFERACVLPEYRKTNVSVLMMDAAMKLSAQRGYYSARGMCEKELLARWKEASAIPNPDLPVVDHHGKKFIEIIHQLPETKDRISMKTPAGLLTLKEGEWFDDKIKGRYELITKKASNHIEALIEKVKILKIKPDKQVFDWHPPLKHTPIDFLDGKKR